MHTLTHFLVTISYRTEISILESFYFSLAPLTSSFPIKCMLVTSLTEDLFGHMLGNVVKGTISTIFDKGAR